MLTYLSKRLLGILPVLFGIITLSFIVIHIAPGKPTDLETQLNPKVSLEARDRLNALYGLDKPLHVQYLNWVKRFAMFDLGNSFQDDRRVADKIVERIPITFLINILSIFFILIIGIPIGVLGAAKNNGLFDRLTTIFVFIGFAVPTFWLALLLMSLFGLTLGWLPISGITSLEFERFNFLERALDISRHLILPVFVSSFTGLAGISRFMKTSMQEVLSQDYIRTARAKGLSENMVLYRHALKNAMLPIVTILGLSVPALIGGSVIFESIFAIPGMGRLFYDSVMARDYPVIMGILTIGAILTLLGNLIADIAYAYVDPRIRASKRD